MWRLIWLLSFLEGLGLAAQENSALQHLQTALSSRDLEAATTWEKKLISSNSEGAETLLTAGAMLAEHDLLRDAAAVFERCAERFPGLFEAKYNLALVQIGLNDYTKAARTLAGIAPASPRESAAVDYLRGKIQLETGNFQEARRSLEIAHRADPENENYALDLGLSCIRSGDYVAAIDVLAPAARTHPRSEEIAIELALSNALAGRLEEALASCRTLLAVEHDRPEAHLIAAFAECRADDFEACRKEAGAGLAMPNANPYLHYLLAEALWNEPAQNSRALAELDSATAAMPACRSCLLLRSKVLEGMQENSRAISDLNALLRLDVNFGPAWARLATLYRKTGDPAAAALAAERFRTLHEKEMNQEVDSFRDQFLRSAQTRPGKEDKP